MKRKSKSQILNIVFCFCMQIVMCTIGAQTVAVNASIEYQTIRGFGGMNHTGWRPDLNEDVREKCFGNDPGEIGMTILRLHVDPDSNKFFRSVPTAQYAYNKGAIVFASPWNPPSDLTGTNASNERKLLYENYNAYVNHLNSFISFMNDSGVPLYAISVQNEPDIEENWTSWTSNEILTFLRENAQDINTKVMAPESFHFASEYNNPILNDSVANSHFDILAGHIYGGGIEDIPLARKKGKEIWMTEHLLGSNDILDNNWNLAIKFAKEINDCMQANFSAYVWWYIQRFYGLISKDGNITDKGYVMSQYTKFIRPGAVRVDAKVESVSNVEISAYKTDTSFVIVAINLNNDDVSLNFNIQNNTIDSLTQFTSSAIKKVVNEGTIPFSNGSYTATIDARSIATFTSYAGNGGKFGNIAPVAKAGADVNVNDNDLNGFETIILDAIASYDSDGEIKNYSWSVGKRGSMSLDKLQISSDSICEVDFDIGEHEVVLSITDNDGATHSDTLQVVVNSMLNTNLWFEAECTKVGENWDIIADEDASNGVYVTVKSGTENVSEPTNNNDYLLYNFNVTEGGRYKVWARVIAPSANDDSYWVKMDDGEWTNWNNIPTGTNWHWDDVHGYANNDSTLSYDLDTGSHTLTLCFREDGALLDKIFISNNGTIPGNIGELAGNCINNIVPVANAGANQNVMETGTGKANVILDGSLSSDDDGTIISYIWTVNDNEIAKGSNPAVDLNVGTHEITLTVVDNAGGISNDAVIIIVTQNTNILSSFDNSDFDLNIYPNPFSDIIYISYSLNETEFVKIELVDVAGRLISTYINNHVNSEKNIININTNAMASGVYYLKFKVGDEFYKCSIIFKK